MTLPRKFNLESDIEYLNRLVGKLMNYKTQSMNADLSEDDMKELIEIYEYVLDKDMDAIHRGYVIDNYGDLIHRAYQFINEPWKRLVRNITNG